MKCKFCFAELEEDVTVCPACGKSLEETPEEVQIAEETVEEIVTEIAETAEEEAIGEVPVAPKKKKIKVWQIALAVAGGIVLLAVLVGAVLYGLGVDLKPRENDLYYKNSYTVDNEKVEKRNDVVIATMGDQVLTVADLQIYYWLSVSNFFSEYADYIQYMGLDVTKPLDEQIYDASTGMTYQHMFLQSAIDEWIRIATLVQISQDKAYTLDEEQQAYLDEFAIELETMAQNNGYEDLDAFVSEKLAPGSTFDSFLKYNSQNYVGMTYYNSIYETMIPTTQEAEVYYTEHEDEMVAQGYGKDKGSYYNVRHILIAPKGGTVDENGETVYSEDEWETCRAEAQEILDGFLAGDATEEAFAALAAEHSTDTGSSSNGGLYTQLTQDTNFVEEFKQWYLEAGRKIGDTGLVKSVYGYHIMYFSYSEPIWEYETKATMLAENTIAILEEAQEKWPIEIEYKKIILGFINLAGHSSSVSYGS